MPSDEPLTIRVTHERRHLGDLDIRWCVRVKRLDDGRYVDAALIVLDPGVTETQAKAARDAFFMSTIMGPGPEVHA